MNPKKLIEILADRPLLPQNEEMLVDRSTELKALQKVAEYHPFGIFGLCGETGIGKTTLLNFAYSKSVYKMQISLTQRKSQDTILYDLLYNISSILLKESMSSLMKLAQDTKEWITEEVSVIKGFELGVNLGLSAKGELKKQSIPRFNFYAAKDKLAQLMDAVIKEKGKVFLAIDELDKESKTDTLNVMDSLKSDLQKEGLVVVFSLPYSIYREYKRDRIKWNESGNLENIIKDVIFLQELGDSEIRELLIRRLKDFMDFFYMKAIDVIVNYADGNPRDALWIAQRIVFENIEKTKIGKEEAVRVIRNTVKEYSSDLSLTVIQLKAIRSLENFFGSKEEAISRFMENGLKRTTAYSTFDRLIELGLIIERRGIYKLSGKANYIIPRH